MPDKLYWTGGSGTVIEDACLEKQISRARASLRPLTCDVATAATDLLLFSGLDSDRYSLPSKTTRS